LRGFRLCHGASNPHSTVARMTDRERSQRQGHTAEVSQRCRSVTARITQQLEPRRLSLAPHRTLRGVARCRHHGRGTPASAPVDQLVDLPGGVTEPGDGNCRLSAAGLRAEPTPCDPVQFRLSSRMVADVSGMTGMIRCRHLPHRRGTSWAAWGRAWLTLGSQEGRNRRDSSRGVEHPGGRKRPGQRRFCE
jgi:hypothetical protein